MKACPTCGGLEFEVVEWESYRGKINEEGTFLNCTFHASDIDAITCLNCGASVAAQIEEADIEVNFGGETEVK